MKANIRRVNGITMVGKSDSGHWVPMDGPESLGGADAGTRPLELFLIGLGGCTGMDVLSILEKKRVKLDDLKIEIDADQAPEHPKIFTKIRLKFIFYGKDIPVEAVERAIELSETKYCSASEMLRRTAELTTEYEIKEKKNNY
jgi:putative redox protein